MTKELKTYSKKTKSGLNVQVIPMPEYNQVYGLAMVDFGSIDIYNSKNNQILPAGIAHFLEHKLFAKDGYDISEKFALYGANSNAYTSYTKTAYLFQTLDDYLSNLGVLLDLVQNPYFTDENVEKERGIINQEVQMYMDLPEWKIEQNLLSRLYPQSPISLDIAGTSESLEKINKENLLETYKTFYNQRNMNLVLVGNVDPDDIFKYVEEHDVNITDEPVIKNEVKLAKPVLPGVSEVSNINQTKTLMGLRIDKSIFLKTPVKLQYMLNMILEILIGETSTVYEDMINSRIINDSFGYSVIVERGYCFVLIGGDTDKPEELRSILLEQLTDVNFEAVAQDWIIERFKRDIIGGYSFSQNSMESIANQQAELYFYDTDYTELLTIISEINKKDLFKLAKEVLHKENMSYYDLIGNKND